MPYALYIASLLGAVALLMMMPRQNGSLGRLGALLGAATLGGLWLFLARFLPEDWGAASGGTLMTYYYLLSAIAIASAVRVITHTRPVYCALWFVMVVLAVAGMLLLLDAEFMAFAMVIIYGGAILATYMFVIMPATQASPRKDQATKDEDPLYDRVALEPTAAVACGFLLLAVLLSVAFQPLAPNPLAADPDDRTPAATVLGNRAAERLGEQPAPGDPGHPSPAASISNVERVGLDLFRGHPLGLELAGVILLVSLAGAVVISRLNVDQETNAEGEAVSH